MATKKETETTTPATPDVDPATGAPVAVAAAPATAPPAAAAPAAASPPPAPKAKPRKPIMLVLKPDARGQFPVFWLFEGKGGLVATDTPVEITAEQWKRRRLIDWAQLVADGKIDLLHLPNDVMVKGEGIDGQEGEEMSVADYIAEAAAQERVRIGERARGVYNAEDRRLMGFKH